MTYINLESVASFYEIEQWLYANAKDWKWDMQTMPHSLDEYEAGIELDDEDAIVFKLAFGL